MRTIREYPRHGGNASVVMHDDEVSFVVRQFGNYHIVAETRDKDGTLLERSTVQLSQEEMQRIIDDFHNIERQYREENGRDALEIHRPGRIESLVSRMLT